MNLKDLDYFCQLAHTLSFTQTATYFNVSQPTITQALKRLENRFQLPLLERKPHSKSIRLTPAGHQLMLTAEQTLSSWEAGVATISRMREAKVRLGIGPSISERYLIDLMRALREANLLGNLEIVEMGAKALAQQLADGAVDMVITGVLDDNIDPNLHTTPLTPLHFNVLANAEHPLTAKTSVTVNELVKFPFITLNGDYLNHEVFTRMFGGATPKVLFDSENPRVVLQAISANIALGFLADLTPIDDPAIRILPIADVAPFSAQIALQYRRQQQHSTLFDTISAIIQQQFSLNRH
ncbi:LysR family transcriptional regulator [Lacticaseibacillus sp. GG6-2]